MQALEEAQAHCRFIGEGIEKAVSDGEDLLERFEGTQKLRFKVEKEGGGVKVVGGELGGDDSGIVVSESGVTKRIRDGIAATPSMRKPAPPSSSYSTRASILDGSPRRFRPNRSASRA